ncbi:MAG: chemotaxis protein CheD [Bacteroidales bacterium]|jgi:chemotaxis protein CheD|nr:chemotaxis protein CheD [Bacteroidales bacterium]
MNNYSSHFLYPAALYASKEPYQINTILGSCVAVCLYDPVLKAGGMCHYMLPLWNGDGLASPKYGNIAIEKLIDKMLNFGSQKYNIKAKIFGGGEVIETQNPHFNIGQRNISLATDMLSEAKIPIISSSVGGKLGRKIIFFTHSGEVKQRYVQKQNNNNIK